MMQKILFLLALGFILSTCGQEKTTNFDSPKSLFVDYISGYTTEVISTSSDIKVKLSKSIEGKAAGAEEVGGLFKFKPEIQGSTSWEDDRTIVFHPAQKLAPGTEYQVIFKIGELVETPADQKVFKFSFKTLIQNYQVELKGLSLYDVKDLTKVKLTGVLQTADLADYSVVEKIITATQSGKALDILWTHDEVKKTHNFSIEKVARTEKESEVKVSWTGKPIEVDYSDDEIYTIPSLNDYKITNVYVNRGSDNFISVVFSDPLKTKQNLNGFITLNENEPRYVIDQNVLKVYPTAELSGEVELKIFKEIKNMAGHSLKEDYVTTFSITQSKPDVRIVANSGVIIPNSDGLIMPFEAVGLKAVDVTIIRIFNDNVFQYLQVNDLGYSDELSRVGRPVMKKTINLMSAGVTDLNTWNRFTLDLADVFKIDPGAIYEVQMGFRPQHSIYFCDKGEANQDLSFEDESWEDLEEGSNWDYYDYYYDDSYDWRQRENPCHASYYMYRDKVKKMLFASNLGLMAKRADEGDLHIFVSDLLTTKALGDISFAVYDYQHQIVGSGISNSKGEAKVKIDGKPFVLIAKQGNQFAYLKLNDASSLSLSNFNVAGQEVQKGIKGFIYGERGVWRPGDDIHLSFILEDQQKRLPAGYPVVMELKNPMGQVVKKMVKKGSAEGLFNFTVSTAPEDPTGHWQAVISAGGVKFSKDLRIETVKPNRLKIDLDFHKDRLSAEDENMVGDLNVKWLHGAVAKGLKAEFDMSLTPIKTVFDKYPNYSFDDNSKYFYAGQEEVFSGTLDQNGHASVNVNVGTNENAPGALRAVFTGKVYEEGGNFSIDKISIPYYPYISFVGIQIPEGDKRGMLLTDKDQPIQIATVDAQGNPISRDGLELELYKLEWKWWWDQSSNQVSNYINRDYQSPIQSATLDSRSGKASWDLRINYPEWGRYFIRVTDPISGHSSGKIVFIDWPGWAGKGKRGDSGGVSMLNFELEKEEYKVGDKIKINIPSSKGSKIITSLETGDRIIQSFWIDTEDESTTIEFEATADMAPNVYANISMIQPHGQTVNDLPIRMYGVQSIKVVDPNTTLYPEIKMPQELSPEQEFTVTVKEKSGRKMAYTLAMVEDGLLDLTKYKTPSPWSSFYAKESLGIKTWDVYDDVIGAYGGKIERLLAIGGDAELEADGKKNQTANRFKPVVKYMGPFVLETGKTATHTIKMPQYVGSVRTMVVAAYEGAYGSAEVTTPVRQPVMVVATLPRVVGPDEEISIPVTVFVNDDKVKSVNVSVSSESGLKLVGSATQTVAFDKTGEKVVYFKAKAGRQLGIAKVKVEAKSGKHVAQYDVEMNLRAPNPMMTDVSDKFLSAGENWQANYAPLGMIGTNTASLEISSLPPLNLEQRMQYLIQYPHGCIEQTVSSVFAQLYLGDLTAVSSQDKTRIEGNITAAIQRLRTFQTNNGGFTYWPGQVEESDWGTNYAGHFLVEAKNAGYAVPEGMLSAWIKYQKRQANDWSKGNRRRSDLVQAYRVYGLALAGEKNVGAMNRLKETEQLSSTAKWRLALAYAIAGYPDVANQLVTDLSTTVEDYNEQSYTYGSASRDEAMILETLSYLDRKEDAFPVLERIAKRMGDKNYWMSTQSTAFCLIGVKAYTKDIGVNSVKFEVKEGSSNVDINTGRYLTTVSLQSKDKAVPLSVSNKGNSPIYVRLIRNGIPLEGAEKAAARNIAFTVRYVDDKGKELTTDQIKQNTNFSAIMTVQNTGVNGDYEELALTHIFPSGWEILNDRLNGDSPTSSYDVPEYADIRDDRVMIYFDLKAHQKKSFEVKLNSAYRGNYYMPAVIVEAMYDHNIYANTAGKWIKVE
ncbi:MG2 domain-containing protein [Reichenbachiella agarivorans]|uniref:MG2 domain-containing protein n=1 Tax=Reichenbachiella agarivorans TaxID=2979464 RepID=A0ABY6CSP0_9BACT|nr:MG2 domain-containing protein [Reichenbachiella agarivorans]UXP33511.1 MG2 domain-containing protein [Reichenbachiella agarivorans]